jgi:hypothetical protein
MLCCVVLCRVVLCCVVFCVVLCCVVLCCVVFCVVLYCVVLCCVVLCYNGFEIVNSNSIWLGYPAYNLHVSCIKFVANYNALNRFIHCVYTGCICNAWTNFKSQFFESKRSINVCP